MLNSQVIENAGGDDGTRTRDLMRDRQLRLGYLVDFAARLATQSDLKARSERSSGTDLVLIFLLFFCHKNCPIAGEIANHFAAMKCGQTMAAVM